MIEVCFSIVAKCACACVTYRVANAEDIGGSKDVALSADFDFARQVVTHAASRGSLVSDKLYTQQHL